MPFARVAAAIIATIVVTAVPRAQSGRAELLYAAYARGDRTAVTRALRTTADYRELQDDLLKLADAWKNARRTGAQPDATSAAARSRIAFAFEVGLARSHSGDGLGDAVRWMTIARELAILRPVPPAQGAVDDDDRFEVLVHRAALAVMIASPGLATHYLDTLAIRIDGWRHRSGGAPMIAPLLLARGVVYETRTRPLVTDAQHVVTVAAKNGGEATLRLDTGERSPSEQDQIRAALSTFTPLAADADVGAEADARCGLLWHRMGNQARALEAVDRGLAASRDPIISYWGQMIRGRVMEAMNRPDDARMAYERAASLVPTAQTPAAAIAAVLLVQDDRAGAERWAARARAPRDGDVSDPWWLYWFGDLRHLDALVRQIRGAWS